MKKRLILQIILVALCNTLSFAQYQASWLSDNYAGVNSVKFNPASPASSPAKWEINFIGFEQYFNNNYGYLRNGSLWNFFKERNDLTLEFEPTLDGAPSTADFVLDFYDGEKLRFANAQTNVLGPSISIKLSERHQVGLFSGFNTAFGSKDVAAKFSYWIYEPYPFFEPFQVTPFMGSVLAWSEVGLNYSNKRELSNGTLTIGGSIKALQGWEAAYFEVEDNFAFTKLPGDTITGQSPNISLGHTSSLANTFPDLSPSINGVGVGADIGVVYTSGDSDDGVMYKYKIAASVMNIGSIKFDKNTSAHRLSAVENVTIASEDYKVYNEASHLDAAVRKFSFDVFGDSTASKIADNFTVTLPTTFNLAVDFNVLPHLYLNAAFVQPLGIGKIVPEIGSHLSITPRFEHRWYGAYLPISYNDWNEVNVGLAGRIGYLILGTENLASVFQTSDMHSTEFFLALKFNPFWKGGNSLGGGGRGKNVKCYDF